jgi:hypothetical protein
LEILENPSRVAQVSSRDFFKSMPAVDVFAYQCHGWVNDWDISDVAG